VQDESYLNGLYGFLGRSNNTLSAQFITFEDINNFSITHRLKDFIPVDNQIFLVLNHTLPDEDLCKLNNISYVKTLSERLHCSSYY